MSKYSEWLRDLSELPDDECPFDQTFLSNAADELDRLENIEDVARKLVYVAAPPVSPIRLALGLPALCEALGIDPVEAAEKACAEEEAAKQRVAVAKEVTHDEH